MGGRAAAARAAARARRATGPRWPSPPPRASGRRREPAPAAGVDLRRLPAASGRTRRPRRSTSAPSTRFSGPTGTRRDSILPVLQAIQARYRYLPEAALRRVCETSDIVAGADRRRRVLLRAVPADADRRAHHPRLRGHGVPRVGRGRGPHRDPALPRHGDGCDTDPTGTFTVERVACIGSCSLAPVITIDDQIYGHLTALSVAGVARRVRRARPDRARQRTRHAPQARPGRRAARPVTAARRRRSRSGSASARAAARAARTRCTRRSRTRSRPSAAAPRSRPSAAAGCATTSRWSRWSPGGRRALYGNVEPRRRAQRSCGGTCGRAACCARSARSAHDAAGAARRRSRVDADHRRARSIRRPTSSKQVRVVLENCGEVDPLSLDEYRQRDGMRALETVPDDA